MARIHTIGGGSTGGGGGTALIRWGPDFGTPGGDSLPQVATLDLEEIGVGPELVQVHAVAHTGLELGTGVAQVHTLGTEVGVGSGVTQVHTLAMPELGVGLDVAQVQAVAMPAVEVGTGVAQVQAVAMPEVGVGPAVAQVHTVGAEVGFAFDGASALTQVSALNLDVLGVGAATAQVQALGGKALGSPFWQSVAVAVITADNPTQVVARPTGTTDGDLLVMVVGKAHVTQTAAMPTPTGWTLIVTNTLTDAGLNYRATSFWRFASSEPSTYTIDAVLMSIQVMEIHRFNGAHATTPINVSATATVAAAALVPDPVSPLVTTTATNCMVMAWLFHFHAALTQTHTEPAAHAERTDGETQGTPGLIFGSTVDTRVFAAAASTGTATHNCTETVSTAGLMQRIAIAPGDLVF